MKMKLYYVVENNTSDDWDTDVNFVAGPFRSWEDAQLQCINKTEFVATQEIEVD